MEGRQRPRARWDWIGRGLEKEKEVDSNWIGGGDGLEGLGIPSLRRTRVRPDRRLRRESAQAGNRASKTGYHLQ